MAEAADYREEISKPAAGNTLHLNIIEHSGEFRMTCLACSEIASLTDALEQVIKAHELPMRRTPFNASICP